MYVYRLDVCPSKYSICGHSFETEYYFFDTWTHRASGTDPIQSYTNETKSLQ